MYQNKTHTRYTTEYERLMNQAAQHLKNNYFSGTKAIKFAFVDYIQERSQCYSRKAIMRDSLSALTIVRDGRIFRDRKHRTKFDPAELEAIRAVTTQNKPPLTEDERLVKGVLEWIRQ